MRPMEKAKLLRPVLEQAMQSVDDTTALEHPEMFPKWSDLVSEGRKVTKGFRFRHGGKLWRTEQAEYTFVETYEPGAAGLESLFSKVDESHAGTIEDPIPYEQNMEVYEGLYYSQHGVTYLCIRSSGQPLYHDLSALVGNYVEPA